MARPARDCADASDMLRSVPPIGSQGEPSTQCNAAYPRARGSPARTASGVLRGAGLIRVRMGSDDAPTYTLREGALSDAHRALVAYLTASTNGGSR